MNKKSDLDQIVMDVEEEIAVTAVILEPSP